MTAVKVPVYNMEGKLVGERSLAPAVFGTPVRPAVLHEALLAVLAASRAPIAHTKTRGEVRGGGKKPWRQKGTGRARAGSIRSPIWIGGGVTFGPRSNRNFSVKLNRKTKNLAIRMSLSDKVAAGALLLLDEFKVPEYKTKIISSLLLALSVKAKKTLLILPARDEKISRSGRNIPGVTVRNAESLSLKEILAAGALVTSVSGAEKIEELFAPKKS